MKFQRVGRGEIPIRTDRATLWFLLTLKKHIVRYIGR